MELKEALRESGLLGTLFPRDPDAAKVAALEETIAGQDETAKAKLELKRMNTRNTVCYILKNNIAPGLKSTLPMEGIQESCGSCLSHKELFTLHDIDSRIMNLRLRIFTNGLDYRPVELIDELKTALPEATVTRRKIR